MVAHRRPCQRSRIVPPLGHRARTTLFLHPGHPGFAASGTWNTRGLAGFPGLLDMVEWSADQFRDRPGRALVAAAFVLGWLAGGGWGRR